jgi:hypothetical protein
MRLAAFVITFLAVGMAGCSRVPVEPVVKAATVTVAFPDFPNGVAVVELGDSLTIDVETLNDGGKGVTWSCAGSACTGLTMKPNSAVYNASGLTGAATITARSIAQPEVKKTLTIVVNLNDSAPLCSLPLHGLSS